MLDTVKFAKQIRYLTMECIESQGSGHIGGCLSIADILAVVYGKFLKCNPKNPKEEGRDRFVLSKGHAGPALYATLSLLGFFPREWLKTLNKIHTRLPSHCHMGLTPGVDMTAGSLGQGLSSACGLAMGSLLKNDNATIFAVVGDGELQEGQNWEALMYAGARGFKNLIVFVDNNKMQIDGFTKDIVDVENLEDKFKAFKFFTQRVDGHDHRALEDAILKSKASALPSCIVCETIKGKGLKVYEELGVAGHSTSVNAEQLKDFAVELKIEF